MCETKTTHSGQRAQSALFPANAIARGPFHHRLTQRVKEGETRSKTRPLPMSCSCHCLVQQRFTIPGPHTHFALQLRQGSGRVRQLLLQIADAPVGHLHAQEGTARHSSVSLHSPRSAARSPPSGCAGWPPARTPPRRGQTLGAQPYTPERMPQHRALQLKAPPETESPVPTSRSAVSTTAQSKAPTHQHSPERAPFFCVQRPRTRSAHPPPGLPSRSCNPKHALYVSTHCTPMSRLGTGSPHPPPGPPSARPPWPPGPRTPPPACGWRPAAPPAGPGNAEGRQGRTGRRGPGMGSRRPKGVKVLTLAMRPDNRQETPIAMRGAFKAGRQSENLTAF